MKKLLHIFLLLLLLSACTSKSQYDAMRRGLDSLNERNRSDQPFTAADVQPYVDFFDSHGTSNDQLLAYYLLGRSYHERGEAPMALKYYQQAIECADTTSSDCDYAQLCRVYGQMSELYYWQSLYHNQLDSEIKAYKYALLANDSITALIIETSMIEVYKELHETSTAINLSEKVFSAFMDIDEEQQAAISQSAILSEYLNLKQYKKAKDIIDLYVSKSGLFDKEGNIEKGREIFFYLEGRYYLETNNLDSAEYFFRKELNDGNDFNNQNAGAKGLALLYQEKNMPDSAAKYALYAYEMNDSSYAQMLTENVEQIKSMYNFNRLQQIAQKESERAELNSSMLNWSFVVIILLCLLTYFIISKEYDKRKKAYEKYQNALHVLKQSKSELVLMRQNEAMFGNLIHEKEQQISRLESIVQQYERIKGKTLPYKERELFASNFYKELVSASNRGRHLSEEDFLIIESKVRENLPDFWELISNNRQRLTEHDYQVCILVRLRIKPQSISNMLNLSPASISKIRSNLLYKLFGTEGKPLEFDKRVINI